MLSGENIERIAQYFSKPVQPVSVETAADVKRLPNDILMSHFMAGLELETEALAKMIRDNSSMESWLHLYADEIDMGAKKHEPPEGVREKGDDAVEKWHDEHARELVDAGQLPELPPGYSYSHPLELIAEMLENHAGFAYGEGKRGQSAKLLVASTEEAEHKYASGRTVDYFLLVGEVPANMPLTEFGYSNAGENGKPEIFVRENFLTLMDALLGVLGKTPEFSQYQGKVSDFRENATGIVIAHEMGEIELARSGGAPEDPVEKELAAEKYARGFLEENKVAPAYYRLFHQLRAAPVPEEGNRNISARVLETL